MFAGPNDSGKSTIKSIISPRLLGHSINPDEIEQELRLRGSLELTRFEVHASSDELLSFLQKSSLLHKAGLASRIDSFTIAENRFCMDTDKINSYYASVLSDFIRQKLLEAGKSFTFETVMSSPDKIELLRRAQAKGFKS